MYLLNKHETLYAHTGIYWSNSSRRMFHGPAHFGEQPVCIWAQGETDVLFAEE